MRKLVTLTYCDSPRYSECEWQTLSEAVRFWQSRGYLVAVETAEFASHSITADIEIIGASRNV